MSGLAQQVAGAAERRQEGGGNVTAEQQISQGIQQRLKRIEAVMPGDHVDAKRMAASVMVQIERVPKLALCSVESIVGACLEVARAELELGSVSGEAWLVPYGKVCTFVLGYKGILRLARRSPEVVSVVARPVFEHDHFAYSYEPDLLEHTPAAGERGELTHAYCRWNYPGGSRDFVVIDLPEIERRRHRGQDGPAWKTDYPAMAAKSAIRAAAGAYGLPMTVVAERALHAEGATITMQERPDGVMAIIEHDPPPALDPAIVVPPDPDTAEVAQPTMLDDNGRDDHPRPQRGMDAAGILEEAGIEPPLHLAVIAKATGGRTTNAAEVEPHELTKVATWARNCSGDPAGFVRAVLSKLPEGSEDEAALSSWLSDHEAAP